MSGLEVPAHIRRTHNVDFHPANLTFALDRKLTAVLRSGLPVLEMTRVDASKAMLEDRTAIIRSCYKRILRLLARC